MIMERKMWLAPKPNLRYEAIERRENQKALMKMDNVSVDMMQIHKISEPRFNAMIKMWKNSGGNIDYNPEIFDRY